MSAVYSHQTTFNRGELSPLLASRTDIDYWRSSTALCTNFLVLRQGGLRRRSGTIFIREVKDSSKTTRLLPFVFNASQAYVLEMGDFYTRFYAGRGQVQDTGSPYEIVSPYAEADLFDLEQVQSADVMYLAHSATRPQKLLRRGDTDWVISSIDFEDGPFLPQADTAIALTPDDDGNRSSSTTLSTDMGTNSGNLNNLKDGNLSSGWQSSLPEGYVRFDFGAGNDLVCDYVSITADNEAPVSAPGEFSVQGSADNVIWLTLGSYEDRSWGANETKHFKFNNETAYRYYRLLIRGPSGTSKRVFMNEIRLKESGASMPDVTYTFTAAADINNGNGLSADDEGRQIRFKGSDSIWRWTKILSVSSPTIFTGRIYGPALPDTNAASGWRLGSFSVQTGYPISVCFFQERLCWGGSVEQPLTVWGSRSGAFEDHGVSTPLVDDDAISVTMLSSQVNQIRWIAEDEDILIGSAGSIRTIGAANRTSAFSATNVEQHRHTTYGSAGVTPARAGNTTIFVGRAARNLRELLYSPEANGYVAPDLSILSSHLFTSGIADMAWQQDPTPLLWVAVGNGELIAVTYDREQQVVGFARHRIAGGQVESVAVIPNASGFDDLYLVVKRTINGATRRYVEVLEREFDSDLTSRTDSIFLDSCLTYQGAAAGTVTGLEHLEGETVGVLADGAVLADQTVSGGQITLPGGATASTIHVGLRYTSQARTLPVAGPGNDGTIFGRRRKPTACFIDLLDTGDIRVGTALGGIERPSDPQGGAATWDGDTDLKSGVWRCDMDGSWTGEGRGQIDFQTSEPLPATVRSLVFQIEGEP